MKIFLFLGSRRGYAVLKKLIAAEANIAGILCLIEDPHEEQYHPHVSHIAQTHSIPIFYSNEVKSSDYAVVLQQIKPDIAFAIGWRYLITKEAYSIPNKGTLIIHDSLLPRYRGFAPMNWAIINGETQTGVTLFYIDEGVDSGPIVDQLATQITLEDTAKTVDEKIIKLYEDIILKNLTMIQTANITSKPQNELMASYTCKRTPEDGEIDWNKPALTIYNLIRGLTHPFPGAYTTLRGKKIFIWEAELVTDPDNYIGRIPGRVLGKKAGMIDVLAAEGIIRLKRLQWCDEEEKASTDISISVKDTFGR